MRSNLTKEERRAITELRNDPDITITEADKGKAVVVMDSLVNNALSDNNTYKILDKDPTAKLERKHKKQLKTLHSNNEISDVIYNKRNPINSQQPYARATIKIHKSPVKTRILVCSRGSVYYDTAQFLSRLLAPLGKEGRSFMSDSSSFVEKLKNIDTDGTMVSYDVVDLFTNIPLDEALDILHINWQNQIYQQIHGLPIGSPLSPVITEIYMTNFEEAALSSSPIKPLCWYWKVDDTFTIPEKSHDPSILLNHLNKQDQRIHFTMETEKVHQLPFLDITIQNSNNQLITSVYRKPTHTDQCIHHHSNHHPQVKTAIVFTLARRAKNICNTSNIQQELAHLKSTFITLNSYPRHPVETTIKKL
ncbi:uncharacterized protein LOC124292119 [Haliotis rubra]|uniref:uncharacterized protein LOC124292119 n=1 Tax=Haliotis rubra TaxID=36100 RepID=UPI001EE5E673|nr:uncharacterized protein LOC124292119 [Haliotis rubra]